MSPRLLPSLLCACLALPVAAVDVYRWVDGEGNVIFSDTPREGAEKVQLRETTIVPGERPTVKLSPDDAVPEVPVALPYTAATIVEPPDQGTLRNDQMVTVTVGLAPALQTAFGHRLQLFVDGQPHGGPALAASFVLEGVERGAHTLEAVVLGDQGEELIRTPSSTFFLHLPSVIQQQRQAKPKAPAAP